MAVDGAGNAYVADWGNHVVRKISKDGKIDTVAGTGVAGFSDGPTLTAQLREPYAVAVDGVGNLYIADTGNNRIRKVSNGNVSTIAGGEFCNGPVGPVYLCQPQGVAVDGAGNVYISDTQHHRVLKVNSSNQIVEYAGTFAALGAFSGDGDNAALAQLNSPTGLVVDESMVRMLSTSPMAATIGSARCRVATCRRSPAIATLRTAAMEDQRRLRASTIPTVWPSTALGTSSWQIG